MRDQANRCRMAPGAWPLLGHAPALLSDRLGFLSRCAEEVGDFVELSLGTRTFLLNDPEDIGHVLIGNHANYGKSRRLTSARGRRLAGNGLLTSSPQEHGPKRRLLRPVFHRETIAKMAARIVSNTQRLLDDWREGDVIDIEEAMARLTRQNIVACLMSADTRDEAAVLDAAVVVRQRYIEHCFRSLLPFPEFWPTPINMRYRRAIRIIDEFIHEAIERRREHGGSDDFLGILLAARHEDGSPMTDAEVRDEVLVFLVTGYETIGEALTWTFYLLSMHPEIAADARAEIDAIVGDRAPEADDVALLPRLRATLAESMRLYPPTWVQVRMAIDDDTLPSGAAIPAGAKLYLCQWVTHRTARYFAEPDAFEPSRFIENGPPAHPKHAYFPFGLGPRRCLGESYALLEAPLILATILQRFSLETVPGQKIIPEPGLILRPRDGLMMRCR